VVQVRPDVECHAADAIALALQTNVIPLDVTLFVAIRDTAAELGVEWANFETADRVGPGGPDWLLLLELVRQAADGFVDDLLMRSDSVLVLAYPSVFARYCLGASLKRIVDGAGCDGAPAILLVVPSHADGAAPSIDGRLLVPAPFPAQRLVMPDAWLENAIGKRIGDMCRERRRR
jgi:hypothetical protein